VITISFLSLSDHRSSDGMSVCSIMILFALLTIWLFRHFQKVSHFISLWPFSISDFGLVGMGKTIMISALIQTSLGMEETVEESASSKQRQLKLTNAFRPVSRRGKRGPQRPSATLIVAPTALLNQWAEEVERSSKPGTVRVIVWHGTNRDDLEAAVESEDENDKTVKVIITSYGTLASEHAKTEKSTSPVYSSKIFSSTL
jgi:hypothetical protein